MDRNLSILMAARLAMSSARAIAGVVTALYLAAEGFSALQIGALFAVVALTSALLSAGIGLTSDALARKPFLVFVPLLAALAAAGYSVTNVPALLFALAAAGSFGRGAGAGGGTVGPYQPAESALVAELVPARLRTTAFGWLAFSAALGALLGGLLAGLARPGRSTGTAAMLAYRPAFVAAAVLAGVAGLLALWLREPARPRTGSRLRLSLPRRSWPLLWRFWLSNGLNGVAVGMVGPFLAYWLNRRYGAGPAEVGLLFAIVNATSLASTLAAGRVAARLGAVRAIVALRALGALLLVPMALAPTFWAAGAVYTIRMLAQRVALPLRQSYVQGVAHAEERASMAALSLIPAQGTQAAGQVLAGLLFDEVGLAAPLEVGALLQLANAVLYGGLFGRLRPAEELPSLADATR